MKPYRLVQRIEGILLIPHELLHIVAHRLIGKDASYRLGDPFVIAREPLSRGERMFVLLTPLVVTWGIGVVLLIVAVLSVAQPFANGASISELLNRYTPLAAAAFLFFVYGGASHGDLLTVIRVLFGKQANDEPHRQRNDE